MKRAACWWCDGLLLFGYWFFSRRNLARSAIAQGRGSASIGSSTLSQQGLKIGRRTAALLHQQIKRRWFAAR